MSFGLGGIIGAILGFFFTRSIFGSIIGYFIGSSFDRVNVRSSANYDQFRDRFRSYQGYDLGRGVPEPKINDLDKNPPGSNRGTAGT